MTEQYQYKIKTADMLSTIWFYVTEAHLKTLRQNHKKSHADFLKRLHMFRPLTKELESLDPFYQNCLIVYVCSIEI